MEENKVLTEEVQEEGKPFFDLQAIVRTLILNWQWFVLCLIIALGCAFIYLRYTTPVYQAYAKMLVKSEDVAGNSGSNSRRGNVSGVTGVINTISGMPNEIEVLKSKGLTADVVRDLKLYITYKSEGRVSERLLYKQQPINVDIDAAHLDRLPAPVTLRIEKEGSNYHVTGSYSVPTNSGGVEGPFGIDSKFNRLPYRIPTRAGIITFNSSRFATMKNGDILHVTITPPSRAAYRFHITADGREGTSIVDMTMNDISPQRALDYLKQIATCYNRQANDDKNQIAIRTEEFINSRIAKINNELGSTEGAIESYKRSNRMVELKMNASQSLSSSHQYEQKLADMETQIQLLNSVIDYVNDPSNKYQVLPTNIGLSDAASSSLINKYNDIVLERNRLLRSASENSPTVIPYTSQLDNLEGSLKQALNQAKRGFEIQRGSIASRVSQYNSEVAQTPEQERVLTQIGRQQEIKSGLYLMLLQKREENSISLAATADKGKLLDEPIIISKVSPRNGMVYGIAAALGLALPALVFFLIALLRYKIEGHDDVAQLTKLPILADVPVASEQAKTKADIVVHENQNNQMEEIFRGMRTNLNFMLKEHEKVVMFTSSTSGEGKTFNAANLAVSYALLSKRVILIGLDIRKPRLAELFEIDDHSHGITPLLSMDDPTMDDIKAQIIPSGVHDDLDLLLAGPIPPNPAELMARPSLETIVNTLKEAYDFIIIDTAPVGLVTDTLQIGRVCNATVYMCRADYTPKASFGMINQLADEGKLPNISIVINGIDMSKKKYGYYYGYGKYGRYARYGSYYGKYGRYGKYGSYGRYGSYGTYGGYGYGNYRNSNYGNKKDNSIKL